MSRKKRKGKPWRSEVNQSEDLFVKKHSVADDMLTHVTINTAHSASIPRDFIRQNTRDILTPLVCAGALADEDGA
jgi:hypothetical protein